MAWFVCLYPVIFNVHGMVSNFPFRAERAYDPRTLMVTGICCTQSHSYDYLYEADVE